MTPLLYRGKFIYMKRDIGLFVVVVVIGLLLALFSKKWEGLGGEPQPVEVVDVRWSPPTREYEEEAIPEEEMTKIITGKPFELYKSEYKIPEPTARGLKGKEEYYYTKDGVKVKVSEKERYTITPLDITRTSVSDTGGRATSSIPVIEEMKKKFVKTLEETSPPPPPPTEICGDGIDNDGDGLIDEGCPPPPVEICGDGIDNDGDGLIDEGCPPSHNVIFAKVGEKTWDRNVKPEFMKAVIVETIKSTGNPFPSSQDVLNWVKNNQDRAGQLLNNISQPYMR
ncbi:MAG: hypothetical protein A2W23_07490 [Planctomycetes bacterium RBG_16_43_13]|nr:MAG: hypothetical protein A2W23_07490 [Planctomycetes bacterium RBG_16_43_13]